MITDSTANPGARPLRVGLLLRKVRSLNDFWLPATSVKTTPSRGVPIWCSAM
jgi:hypothetical protein